MLDLPSEWTLRSVESICQRVTSGGTPSRRRPDYFRNGTIDWYKTGELRDRLLFGSEEKITQEALESSSAKLFPIDTVLLALYGDGDTITTLGLLKQPGATNQACCAMIVDPTQADARFLFYALQHTRNDLLQRCVGGAQRNLSGRLVREHQIAVPPLREQRAIAVVLGSLDDKIEQNRRTGRKLEALARAVFKAWFVDFEPVKAKAAGATAFPGMPPETFAALPDRLQDSPVGPVPQEWEVGTLGDALTLSKQQINPQDHSDELFDHYSIPAFDAGQNAVVEQGGGIKSQKSVVVPGCVLLSKLNPRIARVWLTPVANERRQIASTEFLVALPRPGWSREFLFCLFLQDEFRDSLAQSASGTSNSHQRIRPGDLLTRPLVVPSTFMREAFADQVVPQMQLRSALHAESAKLAAMRDYLLPRLLSGGVRFTSPN